MFQVYLAGISNGIYGFLNAMGGIGQLRMRKIQRWSAGLMIFFGVLLIGSGIAVILRNSFALPLLVVGLVAIHILTLNNGKYMHGKINPGHHILRLVITIVLIVLTIGSKQ